MHRADRLPPAAKQVLMFDGMYPLGASPYLHISAALSGSTSSSHCRTRLPQTPAGNMHHN